nr:tripartite tricarboxylate transporter permease [Amylibacter sp.]
MPVSLDLILAGVGDALTLLNILLVAGGVTIGIFVGAIPGLNGPMAIAIAVPTTFYLSPIGAIGFLVGIMKGSTVGGAVPAILMNTPGTPDAMITTLDGYPLAQKGQSGKALRMAHLSSVTGDTFSDIVLFVAAAPLSVVAMMMGPVEQSSIVFFSICVLAALVGDNPLRGLVAASFGFVLASVGQAPEEATPRLAFGFAVLEDGIPLVAVGMGVLVLGEIVHAIAGNRFSTRGSMTPRSIGEDARLSLAEYLSVKGTMVRSALIGTVIGAVPGIGSALAATLGYSAARQASKTPEAFGKGTIEGVAATEAANSAVSGANLIPLLTLGVPGNVAAAFLMGALIIHGIIPGPTLMRDQGQLVFSLFTCMAIANLCNLVIGHFGMNLFGLVAKVSSIYIFPMVILLCMAGTWVSGGGAVGLVLLGLFGAFGYLLRVLNFSVVIFIIAFVLGRIWEFPLTQAMILTRGDPMRMLHYPVALGFIAAGLGLVLYVVITSKRSRNKTPDIQESKG